MKSKAVTDPFDTLYAMAEHSRHVARPLPQLSIVSMWGGIKVCIKDKNYLIALSQVQEILPKADITPIAGVVDWVLGITNLRGELFCVTDLQGFWFEREQEVSKEARVVLVKGFQGGFGFLVDKVMGLEYFSPDSVQAAPDEYSCVKEVRTSDDGESWLVIDLNEVIQDKRLLEIGLENVHQVLDDKE